MTADMGEAFFLWQFGTVFNNMECLFCDRKELTRIAAAIIEQSGISSVSNRRIGKKRIERIYKKDL